MYSATGRIHSHMEGVQHDRPNAYDEKDPRYHSLKLKQMRNDVAAHAREDEFKVSDPKAQALFESTAEVLKGLVKVFSDFEEMREESWKTASSR